MPDKANNNTPDDFINKSNLATHLDIVTVVLGQLFNKPDSTNPREDRQLYSKDVTFLPFKFTEEEAELLGELFETSPFEAEVWSPTSEPVPNDYYRLKLILLMTHIFKRGLKLASVELLHDSTKRKEMKEFCDKSIAKLAPWLKGDLL